MKFKILVLFFFLQIVLTFGQNYRSPLDIPLILSANCGELRPNHFHSGIDIKTQGVIGKPVYSIEDGYISRISISPSGYGLALYVTHPSTGHTSVYGHLDRFTPKITSYAEGLQYQQEAFRLDTGLNQNQFPVKKGEIIAYSGNTGSSGGPHVHFEIRDTKTEQVLDPLTYFKGMIRDTQAPDVRGIAVYPVPGRGAVNGSSDPLRQSVSLVKNGVYSDPKQSIEAWGTIGLGIRSYDKMDNTTNVYGVKNVRLFVDDQKIFDSQINNFSFSQSRMINSFVDYSDLKKRKTYYMRSFIEPGNELPFYSSSNKGYFIVDKERPYKIRYELEDIYGNETKYNFVINGKKQDVKSSMSCMQVFAWNKENKYEKKGFKLVIPKGNLYNDVCFVLSQRNSENYFSPIFSVNKEAVPLHKFAEVELSLVKDSLLNKKQYGIIELRGANKTWLGGTYANGSIKGNINELGIDIVVSSDTKAPSIIPLQSDKWVQQGCIKLKVTDDLSGIKFFKGFVDGKYALFKHDVKSNVYSYKIDPTRIEKGIVHKLLFIAVDNADNKVEYSATFRY